jgi:hypothetical protein
MQRQELGATDWRYRLWLGLLVAASVGFTLGFACAVPFAAFGAAAALTLTRRDALLLVGAVWLANQIVGFAAMSYPWDGSTLTWGLILGGIAILSTLAPQGVMRALQGQHGIVVAAASFAGAFLVYEIGLYLISATLMGGIEDFEFGIVARIFEINAAAFAGLLALNRLGSAITPSVTPALARS